MEKCYCCGTDNSVFADRHTDNQHKSCRSEMHRRMHYRLCIYCGIALDKTEIKAGIGWHKTCVTVPESYTGYPHQ